MGLVENIKTYMEQSSERKLFSKKLGVKACCVEAGIYDNSDTFKLVAQIKNSKILEFKQTKWLKELNI